MATAGRPRCHGGEADPAAGRPSSAVPKPRVMTRPRQTLISPCSACPLAVLRPRLDSVAGIVILSGGASDRVFSTCSPTTTGSLKPPRTPGCLSLYHTIPERCGDRYSQSPSLT